MKILLFAMMKVSCSKKYFINLLLFYFVLIFSAENSSLLSYGFSTPIRKHSIRSRRNDKPSSQLLPSTTTTKNHLRKQLIKNKKVFSQSTTNLYASESSFISDDNKEEKTKSEEDGTVVVVTEEEKKCKWKSPRTSRRSKGRNEDRIKFEDLKVGQALVGKYKQEYLTGNTGPKVWFDCGVYRVDKKDKWHIVTGMHRMTPKNKKKKNSKSGNNDDNDNDNNPNITQFFKRKKRGVNLWVSRIYPDSKEFEVVTSKAHIPNSNVPVSSLKINQEVIGTIEDIKDFGVFVDVGVNRNGLLHIKKVGELYGQYIEGKEGLMMAGLEQGIQIRIAVDSIVNGRLYLDFTEEVKLEARKEQMREDSKNVAKYSSQQDDDDDDEYYASEDSEEDDDEGEEDDVDDDVDYNNEVRNDESKSIREQQEEEMWAAYNNNESSGKTREEEEEEMWAAYNNNNESSEKTREEEEAEMWAAYNNNNESSGKTREEEEAEMWAAYNNNNESSGKTREEEEAEMWAAYNNGQIIENEVYEDDDDDDDDYDEDRNIEDALGLGRY